MRRHWSPSAALLVFALLIGLLCSQCQGTGSGGGGSCGATLLTCRSPHLPDGKVCCVVAGNMDAWVGYAVAFGPDEQWIGCYETSADADYYGAQDGRTYTVVRCQRE